METEHAWVEPVKIGRTWNVKCSCGWDADTSKGKARRLWEDHVVDARYEEHMREHGAAA